MKIESRFFQMFDNFTCQFFLYSVITLLIVNVVAKKLKSFIDWYSMLAKIPQEPANPLTGHLSQFNISLKTLRNLPEKDIMAECNRIVKKYFEPGIVMVRFMWKPLILIINYKVAKILASENGLTERGGQINLVKPWIGDSLAASSEAVWRAKRQIVSQTLKSCNINNFTKIIHRHTINLIDKLCECDLTSSIDLSQWVHLHGLGYIVEIISGNHIDFLGQQGLAYFEALKTIKQCREMRIWSPIFSSDLIFSMINGGRQHAQAIKLVQSFSNNLVQQSLQQIETGAGHSIGTAIVKGYLDKAVNEGRSTINMKEVREEIDGLIMGAFDTLPTTTTFALYLLGLNPSCQDKLYQELCGVDKHSETDYYNAINQLSYLDAVVKESLRLYPPIPFAQRTIKNDLNVNGLIIPKGTNVTVAIYFIHRDPLVFPEPDSFNPDRWIQNSKPPQSAYLPFGFGLRYCVGKKLGLVTMKLIISCIIRQFAIESQQPITNSDIILSTSISSSVPFNVILKKR